MATFTNQAQLTFNGTTVNSNVAVGSIASMLTVTKTAVSATYGNDDTVTYLVSIINSGATALSGLTVTDDLGAYAFGAETRYPLSYVEDSVKILLDGVPVDAPDTEAGPPLVFENIDIPAGGNVILAYETRTNEFAPLEEGASITNTVTVSGDSITPVTAEETVNATDEPLISVTKSIRPVPVAVGGLLTYTFVLQNYGNRPLAATDNAVITDSFDPILFNLTASFDGGEWTEGDDYTYDEETGLFNSTEGRITVPAATFEQDPLTGAWVVTPGERTLIITGTI